MLHPNREASVDVDHSQRRQSNRARSWALNGLRSDGNVPTTASDRASGKSTKAARRPPLSSAWASRQWVLQRHALWAPAYRRARWTAMPEMTKIATHKGNWTSIAEGLDIDC
jgi:hypothetical protein